MELQIIENKIFVVRGQRVMFDFSLAELYGVETRALKQAVKRNIERFPADFMFELTKDEWREVITICDNLPQTAKFSPSTPLAFTEFGVAMLSSVLRSEKAIEINISIMRAFLVLRQYALGYADLNRKLEEFMIETNIQFSEIYQALTELATQKELENKPRKRIGFNVQNDET
ncbi:ORF6N domain-containing protein [Bacteroidales bacterium OttesenSCG-928-K03]|nr:ORF6N domain-containing protein [Odoribacter sp. OttesenSCG-928-L07]MDL2239922.1 ORF6N domain-containing protein [Bacteroidales bacterium OttesenSCG-928-L14]MDL2240161.1 ORF6N domain-containing protein [Bacteroidales bacterium OttesenSCG-928-K22]MDL2242484.1 ORF6N domain-containing protein [Bacteroidales bacterium OttesenSCG-928-K03]